MPPAEERDSNADCISGLSHNIALSGRVIVGTVISTHGKCAVVVL